MTFGDGADQKVTLVSSVYGNMLVYGDLKVNDANIQVTYVDRNGNPMDAVSAATKVFASYTLQNNVWVPDLEVSDTLGTYYAALTGTTAANGGRYTQLSKNRLLIL